MGTILEPLLTTVWLRISLLLTYSLSFDKFIHTIVIELSRRGMFCVLYSTSLWNMEQFSLGESICPARGPTAFRGAIRRSRNVKAFGEFPRSHCLRILNASDEKVEQTVKLNGGGDRFPRLIILPHISVTKKNLSLKKSNLL